MDKLEREIQENYIYGRPAPSHNPYASAATPRHMSKSSSGNYFPPGRYLTPDVRITRSDASDYSPEVYDASLYPGRGYEYREPAIYHASRQSGWHGHQPSSSDFARLSNGSQSYAQQYYAPPPPLSASSSTSWNNSRTAAMEQHPSEYYGSQASQAVASARTPLSPSTLQFSPSQMQLVSYDDGGRPAPRHDDSDDQHGYTSEEPSPHINWSMDATQGTAMSERVMSDASSQGVYSEDSALSGYSDVTRSSGYAASYDVASHGDYRGDYRDSEDDHDYMSDDVASNEGEYYSSGDEPEYDDDADDVYSDEGSDSYDDGYDYSD